MATIYRISGMTCGGCVNSVCAAMRKALPKRTVKVDLDGGTLSVEGDHDSAVVRQAVEAAGFDFLGSQAS